MGYLFDTSICVFFLRGRLNRDIMVKEIGLEKCYISVITVAEPRFGAEKSDDPVKSNKAVDLFLKGLTIIPIFGSIKRYAIEKVRLRKIGKPINDEFDLLIGVTAIENQLILVTDNSKDFKLLDGIRMENWFERN